MEGYSVLFNREFIGKESKEWILKPIKIIEGFYDVKKEVFVENDKKLLRIDNIALNYIKETECVGNIITKEEIINQFQTEDIEQAKEILLNEMKSKIIVGHYDNANDSIEYSLINISDLTKNVLDLLEYPNKTDQEIEIALNNYEKLKEEIGEDFSMISTKDLEILNSIDKYNTLSLALNFILFAKEEYNFKTLDNNDIYILSDKRMNEILDSETLIEMKTKLNNIINEINTTMINNTNIPDISNIDNISIIMELHESVYNDIMISSDILSLKKKLEEYLDMFHETLDDIINSDYCDEVPKTIKFNSVSAKKIEELLKLDDMNEIKKELEEFHYSQLEMIEEMEDELYDDDYDEEYVDDEKLTSSTDKTDEIEKKYIFNYNEVKEKMVSRIIGRDIQIDRILTTIERNDKLKNLSKRQSMIIAGTTGTGKTQTFSELKNALSNIRPVNIVDTNQLTEEGYVGGTIEDNVLASLIIDAHRINSNNKEKSKEISKSDVELARHGIVILDEIDKRAELGSSDNVNKSGVVNQILKLMDPNTKYMVKINHQVMEFDTSNLTIFASGAFQEYFDELDKPKNSLGFMEVATKKENLNDYKKYQEVDPLELVKYGLDRQFVGRFNRVTLFPSHTKESLLELENNKATSNVQVEIDNYKEYGIPFVWEDGYIEEVVRRAYEMKTGGRALNNIVARSLGTLNTEVNNHKDEIKTIFVPISSIDDPTSILLIDKNNNPILLRELIEETEKKNLSLKQINNIERDNESYNSALSIYKNMQNEEQKIKVLTK